MSRIPVREALSSLHEAGWVDIGPRYGVYVRDRDRTELHELFEARAAVEAEIARLAAVRQAQTDIVALRQVVEHTKEAATRNDIEELSRASVEFNACIRKTARNSVLGSLSLGLEKRARFYLSPIAGLLGRDSVENQALLVDLVAAGESDGAATAARQHIVNTGHAASRLLQSDAFST